MKPYALAQDWLLSHAEQFVKHIYPAAELQGNDCLLGDFEGNPGDSLRITVKGPKTGWYKDFATGEKASRNLCALWKRARQIAQDDHQTFFAQLATFSGQYFGYEPPGGPIDWHKCLAEWSQADATKLVKLRGYKPEFVRWLHDVNRGIGTQYGQLVFPVIGPDGKLSGLQRYIEEERILKFSKGTKVSHPLVFGDMTGPITEVHVHESRWDCYALASATNWHLQPGVRFIATLSAVYGRLVKGQIPPGARVYCWVQHDPPGKNGKVPNQDWLKVVAANAGCEILRVDIPLEHKDLNDWTRAKLVTELDLAWARDSAQPFRTETALTVQVSPAPASKLFPPENERPCYRLCDAPFQEDGISWKAGVYLHAINEKTNQFIDHWILSVVRVKAITRTDVGKEHGYLLEFVSHGETTLRHEVMPQSLLVGHINDLMKFLRDLGISALFKNRDAIRDYLDSDHKKFSAQKPEDFWESVKVVGWHSPHCFVLPDRVIGTQNGIWFQGAGEGAQYASNGNLDDWKNQVAKFADNNPYLLFALSCGLGGPLLNLLNVIGIGFHFLGDSTSGKTTALLVATSVWGGPKFMLSWRQTANRLEAQAASRSDCLMTIDESHMIDPGTLDACIYLLLGGVSKGRLKRDSTAAESAHWRIPVLSSGERALETHLLSAQIDHKAGQAVRMCDIPVGGKFGVFDQLPPQTGPAAFADILRTNAAKTYGTAGPAFVKQLLEQMPKLNLHAELTEILKSLDTDTLSGQQQRVWRSFAWLVWLAN